METNDTNNSAWPFWLVIGAEIDLLRCLGASRTRQTVRVERFTKTQCVLSNGERFRITHVSISKTYLRHYKGDSRSSVVIPKGAEY